MYEDQEMHLQLHVFYDQVHLLVFIHEWKVYLNAQYGRQSVI
jgi:hypothetical protein